MLPLADWDRHVPGVLLSRGPIGPALPLVFDSPHSGRDYPEDFGHSVPVELLRRAEDAFVDELIESAPSHGATLLTALFPRSYIDPNRHEHEVDPAMLGEPWPHPILASEKSEMGLGLVRRLIKGNVDIYDRPLSADEILARIEGFHRPYMTELERLLDAAHGSHGVAWHINCHSMRSAGRKRGQRIPRADIVLGDRDGTSCGSAFTAFVAETVRGLGYRVALNDPFKGAELVARFGRPDERRHSLQIEINRALYMDEDRIEKRADFASFKQDMDRLIGAIADYVRDRE
ncbi:MAG TPA: N-formylglutamate amidohydrolase [Dongiaceae bacterium]|jgi:N-formylglutamate amidohydrolase|nr:N-formylglutamate amidohydrolase [Dongiaceae bacterium]